MTEFSTSDAWRILQEPELIWAPNGATFVYRVVTNDDAKSIESLFDRAAFIRHELRGPGEEPHLWLFSADLDLLDDPDHGQLNPSWQLLARVALSGYMWLKEEWPI